MVRLHGIPFAGAYSCAGIFSRRQQVVAPDYAGDIWFGFLARPIGALLFGQLGDRVGRKRALMVSALLMAAAKLIEGLLPTYATIGFLAPAVFVCARIISGITRYSVRSDLSGVLCQGGPCHRHARSNRCWCL